MIFKSAFSLPKKPEKPALHPRFWTVTTLAIIRRLRRGPFTPGLAAALVAGVILHVAGLALAGLPWRMPAPPTKPAVFVHADRSDSVLNEQASLMDPSPLFLPTSLNYSAGYSSPRASASEAPPLAAPEPALTSRRMGALLAARTPLLSPALARRAPADRLPPETGDTFFALGRGAPRVETIAPLGAQCVMRDEATGAVVAQSPLPPIPAGSDAADFLRPAVFFVETDAYGASPPVLRESSGDAACDARLAEALVRLLARRPLPARRMNVTVAP